MERLPNIETLPLEPNISVRVGNTVTLRYVSEDEEFEETFRIVNVRNSPDELSTTSPIGRAILKKKIGDIESVNLSPDEHILIEILAIE